jgi:hypothetical protein
MTDALTRDGSLRTMAIQYLKEVKYLKIYMISIGVFFLICYGFVIISDEETIALAGDEDRIFEWLTCIFFAAASVFFFLAFIKTRNLFFLIFSLVFLFGAGEEISWGQRLLGFETPQTVSKINVQKEFNLHNIEIFNNKDLQGNIKKETGKLLDMNFLFKLFVMLYGILLPLSVFHLKFVSRITQKLSFPVPPVSIGGFFFLSWIIYQLISIFLLADCSYGCFASFVEIFECTQSFVLAVISIYFFFENKKLVPGKDIKQTFR